MSKNLNINSQFKTEKLILNLESFNYLILNKMKTENARSDPNGLREKWKKWMRFASSLTAVTILLFSSIGQAQARILFEDDAYFSIDSEGIILDANDNAGADTIEVQFGNDGTDASITYDPTTGDLTILTPADSDLVNIDNATLTSTSDGGLDFRTADRFSIRENADPNAVTTGAVCTSLGELIYDTSDTEIQMCTTTGAAGTAVWTAIDTYLQDFESVYSTDADKTLTTVAFDIDASGAVGIDSDSALTLGGAGVNVASDGTGNEVDITSAGTGTSAIDINVTGTGGDLDIDVDDAITIDSGGATAITIGGIFDIDSTGAVGIDSDAGVTIGGTAIGITADSGILALTGDGTADIDILNTGAAIDIGSATYTLDTTSTATITTGSTYDIDSVGAVGIDSDAGVTIGGTTISLTADSGILAITGDGSADIDILNTSAAIDIGSATFTLDTTGIFSIDGVGASNVTTASGALTLSTTSSGDVTISAADDVTITAGDDIIFDDTQLNGTVQMSVADSDWDSDFATDGIIDNINDITTQLGGDSISTFGFAEDNVLADNDALYAALDKLDLEWGDLGNTANGEGASLVGVEDAGGYFAGTDTEAVLQELGVSVSVNGVDLKFYPEYPDATIYADGATNKGTLESLYDAAQDTNYYNWTTTEAALQDINIQFMFILPPDYDAIGTNGLQFEYRTGTNTDTDNKVDVIMYERTGAGATTSCGSDLTNVNGTGAAGAFATGQITKATIDGGACTLTAGDIILIEVILYDNTGAADFADVGYITLDYDN
jgi:hypothetical protein